MNAFSRPLTALTNRSIVSFGGRPVKLSFLPFCLLLPLSPAVAQGHPILPGIRQADQVEDQTQKNIPPPATQRSHIDYAEVEQLKLTRTHPSA